MLRKIYIKERFRNAEKISNKMRFWCKVHAFLIKI